MSTFDELAAADVILLTSAERESVREFQDDMTAGFIPLSAHIHSTAAHCYYCDTPLAACCERDRSGPGGCCCDCGGEGH